MTDTKVIIKHAQASLDKCYPPVARLLTPNESGGPIRNQTLFTQVCDHITDYSLRNNKELQHQVRKGCITFYKQHLRGHLRTNKVFNELCTARNKFAAFMTEWMCNSEQCPANTDNVSFSDVLKTYETSHLPKVILFNKFYLVYREVSPKLYIPTKATVVQKTCEYIAEHANLDTTLVTCIITFTRKFMKETAQQPNLKTRLCQYVNQLSKHLAKKHETDNPSSSNSRPLTVDELLTMFKVHAVAIYPPKILPAPDGWYQGRMKPSSSSAPSASGSSPKDTEISSLQHQLKRKTGEFEDLKEQNNSLQHQLKRKTGEFEDLKEQNNSLQHQLKRKTDEFEKQQKETDRFKFQKTELTKRVKILMKTYSQHQKLDEAQQRVNEAQPRVNKAQQRVNEAQQRVNEGRRETAQQYQHTLEQWEKMDRQK
jgi:hypothetical protein